MTCDISLARPLSARSAVAMFCPLKLRLASVGVHGTFIFSSLERSSALDRLELSVIPSAHFVSFYYSKRPADLPWPVLVYPPSRWVVKTARRADLPWRNAVLSTSYFLSSWMIVFILHTRHSKRPDSRQRSAEVRSDILRRITDVTVVSNDQRLGKADCSFRAATSRPVSPVSSAASASVSFPHGIAFDAFDSDMRQNVWRK